MPVRRMWRRSKIYHPTISESASRMCVVKNCKNHSSGGLAIGDVDYWVCDEHWTRHHTASDPFNLYEAMGYDLPNWMFTFKYLGAIEGKRKKVGSGKRRKEVLLPDPDFDALVNVRLHKMWRRSKEPDVEPTPPSPEKRRRRASSPEFRLMLKRFKSRFCR